MAPGRRALSSWMASLANGPSRSSTPNAHLIRPESTTPPQLQSDENLDSRTSSPSPSSPSSVGERRSSRPVSMVQPFHPPVMEVNNDTIPELQPIFTFLNNHSTKLYQEGYFLKLHDRDPSGRPTANRTWTECFAQLVGTVLSLWDASSLDHQDSEGEVTPSFINLSDASIKLIESLATRSPNAPPLQNVLSVSTAGNNLYLFHFSSHHAMVQWAAAIRLAMFEQSCLQESYTGSLIAGKGKSLVGIADIMQYTKFKTEDWVRVRFGAGTPWRRCWCVVCPPDEKQIAKDRKMAKKSAYQRGPVAYSKGDIKFYETKKTKKITPIATIKNAHSVYALYPQSKHLIEQSTLVKIEGQITIHAKAPATSDGIVFVMPEVHPGITGFETMIRFLFRSFDVFALYGRPGRLVADPLDSRSLMFGMPRDKTYGCLSLMDVVGLINDPDSKSWSDAEWRKRLKQMTSKRLAAIRSGDVPRRISMHRKRSSLPSRPAVKFDGVEEDHPAPAARTGTAPIGYVSDGDLPQQASHMVNSHLGGSMPPPARRRSHRYSDSESRVFMSTQRESPPPQPVGMSHMAPMPPPHAHLAMPPSRGSASSEDRPSGSRSSSESVPPDPVVLEQTAKQMRTPSPDGPVATPPQFSYAPGARPPNPPRHSFIMASEKSRISDDTLAQLATAGGFDAAANAVASWRENRDAARSEQSVARITATPRSDSRSSSHSQPPPVPTHSERKAEQPPPVPTHQFAQQAATHAAAAAAAAATASLPEPVAFINPRAPPSTPQFARTPLPPAPSPHTPLGQEKQLSPPPTPPDHHIAYPSPAGAPVARTLAAPRRFSFEKEDSPTEPNLIPAPSPHDRSIPVPMNTPLAPPPNVYAAQSTTPGPTPPLKATPMPDGFGETSPSERRYSITRKPVPGGAAMTPALNTPMTSTSMKDLRRHLIDEDAMNRIVERHSNPALGRQDPLAGPLENSELKAPDYHSSRPSDPFDSSEKPRTGVLKVVGALEAPGHFRNGSDGKIQSPAKRSSQESSGRPPYHDRNTSQGSLVSVGRLQQESLTPPGGSPQRPSTSHTPDGEPRMSWMPGMARPNSAQGHRSGAITPEQFVQQRAAVANQTKRPYNVHSRESSGHSITQHAQSSPLAPRRAAATETPSPKFAPRTSSALGYHHNVSQEFSLSAREQEQLSRMTGSPLVDIGKHNQQLQPSGGLVGVIAQRDRERKAMREGYGNIMMQQPRPESPSFQSGRPESPSFQNYHRQHQVPSPSSSPMVGYQPYHGYNQAGPNSSYSQGFNPGYGQNYNPAFQPNYGPPNTPPEHHTWNPAPQYPQHHTPSPPAAPRRL